MENLKQRELAVWFWLMKTYPLKFSDELIPQPIFTRKDTKQNFQWRIRNLPYPVSVYDVTIDKDNRCCIIRTSNKKWVDNFVLKSRNLHLFYRYFHGKCSISVPDLVLPIRMYESEARLSCFGERWNKELFQQRIILLLKIKTYRLKKETFLLIGSKISAYRLKHVLMTLCYNWCFIFSLLKGITRNSHWLIWIELVFHWTLKHWQ